MQQTRPAEEYLAVSDYARALALGWRTVVLVTALAVAAGLGASLLAPSTYRATSSVFLATGADTSSRDLRASFPLAQSQVRSFSALATTPLVLEPVVRDLQLPMSADQLADHVRARARRDAQVIAFGVTMSSPTQAARVADAVAAGLQGAVARSVPGTAAGVPGLRVQLLAPATVPSSATSPRTRLNAAVALVVGLLCGCLLVLRRATPARRGQAPVSGHGATPRLHRPSRPGRRR